MKVLITDVQSRKSFDIVNIVQNKYRHEVILCAPCDNKFKLPIIYFQKIYRLRSSRFDYFKEDLDLILLSFQNEKVIYLPVSDLNTRNILNYSSLYKSSNLYFSLPTLEIFDLVNNKTSFIQIAKNANVSAPISYEIEDLNRILENKIQVILKPKNGQGSVGIKRITEENSIMINNINLHEFEIQEFIKSDNHPFGVFFLCKDGVIIDSYVHRRIRTFPPSGGVTVFSEIVQNKEIIILAEKITRSINWNGLGMIEFMYDKVNNIWKCIEFNPRVWGSILLDSFSGVNLLNKYILLLSGEKVSTSQPINYDARVSWLYPFEILNLVKGFISIKEFRMLFGKNISIMNYTYSNSVKSFIFIIYFTLNIRSIKRFIQKLKV